MGYCFFKCLLYRKCRVKRTVFSVLSSVIDAAEEIKCFSIQDKLQFPIVMKVIGSVHKTEAGGVILNIANEQQAANF